MPLFPYLPVIVWMGMINIMLSAADGHEGQSMNDPSNWTSASILPFPTPVTAAVVG